MCGIIAYTGRREAAPLLIEGLRRLEYRGYDRRRGRHPHGHRPARVQAGRPDLSSAGCGGCLTAG